ncbi:hypothetical protein [Nostoc sp. LPT]|uniref:hypothetical protein n=1 Tax=Nostoc sp. LPT TaxID=2815387 RepID=UPI001D6B9C8D|nr:hypothetical protein [Nostoc sp. LPT]MBN4001877.1 hypothetical protein [Nostoc sp. LPT]
MQQQKSNEGSDEELQLSGSDEELKEKTEEEKVSKQQSKGLKGTTVESIGNVNVSGLDVYVGAEAGGTLVD